MGIAKKSKLATSVLLALIVMGASFVLTIPAETHAQTLVQTTTSANYTTSGASASLSGYATAGDAIVVLFQAVVTGSITTPMVSDSRGTTFTQSVSQGYYYSGDGYLYLNFIDCGILTTSGPESVSVSLQNSGFRVEVIEVQGISCQNPFSSSGEADSGSSISTSTLVPFPSGGIAVASIIGNGAVSAGGGYTLLEALSGDNFVSEFSLLASNPTSFPATNGNPGQARYGGSFWLEIGAVFQSTGQVPVVTETVVTTQTVIVTQTYTAASTVTATEIIPTTVTSTLGVSSVTSDPVVIGFGLAIVALLVVLIALLARRPPSVPH